MRKVESSSQARPSSPLEAGPCYSTSHPRLGWRGVGGVPAARGLPTAERCRRSAAGEPPATAASAAAGAAAAARSSGAAAGTTSGSSSSRRCRCRASSAAAAASSAAAAAASSGPTTDGASSSAPPPSPPSPVSPSSPSSSPPPSSELISSGTHSVERHIGQQAAAVSSLIGTVRMRASVQRQTSPRPPHAVRACHAISKPTVQHRPQRPRHPPEARGES